MLTIKTLTKLMSPDKFHLYGSRSYETVKRDFYPDAEYSNGNYSVHMEKLLTSKNSE